MTAKTSDRRSGGHTTNELASALAGGSRLLTGRYRVELGSGRWWWSDEIFLLHGYEPGAVEPSLDAIRDRLHPDERGHAERDAKRALAGGGPFASAHRVVDVHGRTRTLLVTGQVRRGPDGRPAEIRGSVVDITPVQREALDREVRRAIDNAFVSAAAIEQAKGVLMAAHGVDVNTAENLLADAAGATGAGMRETAAQLMARLAAGEGFGHTILERVREAFDAVRPSKRPHVHEAQLARRRAAA